MATRNNPALRKIGRIDPAQIEAHAHDCRYCGHELSKLYGCSVRQMERLFQNRFQRSPHAWLHDLRMRRAVELIRDGTPVKEVAAILGFKSSAAFIRSYRITFGRSPGSDKHGPSYLI